MLVLDWHEHVETNNLGVVYAAEYRVYPGPEPRHGEGALMPPSFGREVVGAIARGQGLFDLSS